ncbi:MAG: FAD-dependent oxidoreductase [Dehalococcoidia bacterium]
MGLEKWGRVYSTDVLVIGGGLAGAFAAIKAREKGAQVLVVDKAKAGKSGCSAFAAGVLNMCFPYQDDLDAWREDALEQGCFLNDQEWLEVMLKETFECIQEMDAWGVAFEKTPEGQYERRHMRGSVPGRPVKAVMFHGPQMMEAMAEKAVQSGVKVVNRAMVVDLLVDEGQTLGAVGFDVWTGKFLIFLAKATVVAAGGTAYKGLFANHKMQSGDSSAMLYRAGAVMSGMDICSHHASAAPFDILGMNMFVSLGGRFVNARGERFLPHYDPVLHDHTLARTYAQAMALEVMAGRGPIYMDLTHFRPEDVAKLRRVLPLIMKNLGAAGVVKGDRIVKKMEYVASCQGTIGGGGGVRIDLQCKTNLPGLYAVGDAAHRRAGGTGSMGMGALAFAAVSGARAGQSAGAHSRETELPQVNEARIAQAKDDTLAPLARKEGVEPDQVVLALQETIIKKEVFVITNQEALKRALAEVNYLAEYEVPQLMAYDGHYLRMAHEAKNMALTAQLWLRSALQRKESRGGMLRQDFPNTDNVNGLHWVLIKQKDGQPAIEVEDIPFDKYRFKPKKEVFLAPMWQKANERGIKWA